jgi:predicted enzyme related to lactoylglutathione lyase
MGSTAGSNRHHTKLQNFVSWFEIPVYEIHRAAAFYNAIYGMEMEVVVNGEFAMGYFPADSGIGGALIAGPGCVPNDTGTLVYLNAGNDMDTILGRIDLSGGRVIMPKTMISETAGSFALFIDSEGNRVALHEGAPRAGRKAIVPKPVKAAAATKAVKPQVKAKKAATKVPSGRKR